MNLSGHDFPTIEPAADSAAFARLLNARHSCRAFKPEPVPRATIEAILATAQRTASWNNTQPWQVIVTTGAATERFRDLMVASAQAAEPPQSDLAFPREYRGVYLHRRRACGFQLYDAVGVQRGDRPAYARQALRNYQLFDAPHVAIVTSDEALGTYGAIDCGAYVTNFMTAAQSLGVATIAQAALAVHCDKIRAHFSISRDRQVVCGISFGFADPAAPANQYRTTRAGLDEVVRWVED